MQPAVSFPFPPKGWRRSPYIKTEHIFKKKFAYFPVTITSGGTVFWKDYYVHIAHYGTKPGASIPVIDSFQKARDYSDWGHPEVIQTITEAEYIVIKLKGENVSE